MLEKTVTNLLGLVHLLRDTQAPCNNATSK